jgi:Tfp pilus assembly protein PilO
MKTSVRRSSWIVTIPVAAAAVAYLCLCFLPESRVIGEARDQVRQEQNYVVEAARRVEVLNAAVEELRQTQAYNATWVRHAPTERDLSAAYGEIHDLAKASGATITRMDPEPPVRYETVSRTPLKVECVGSFVGICGFLERLEGLPQEIWVTELHLERSREERGPVLCQMTLGIFASNPEDSDYVEHSE